MRCQKLVYFTRIWLSYPRRVIDKKNKQKSEENIQFLKISIGPIAPVLFRAQSKRLSIQFDFFQRGKRSRKALCAWYAAIWPVVFITLWRAVMAAKLSFGERSWWVFIQKLKKNSVFELNWPKLTVDFRSTHSNYSSWKSENDVFRNRIRPFLSSFSISKNEDACSFILFCHLDKIQRFRINHLKCIVHHQVCCVRIFCLFGTENREGSKGRVQRVHKFLPKKKFPIFLDGSHVARTFSFRSLVLMLSVSICSKDVSAERKRKWVAAMGCDAQECSTSYVSNLPAGVRGARHGSPKHETIETKKWVVVFDKFSLLSEQTNIHLPVHRRLCRREM